LISSPEMRTAVKRRKAPKAGSVFDPATRQAATDETLQVMYWLRAENIVHEVALNDFSKWVGLPAPEIEPLLIHSLGAGPVERIVVDSGAQDGVPRFRLTAPGVREGRRRFAEEFATDLTKPRHFEHSAPDCECENTSRFSVSLRKSLFRQLDAMIKEKGYDNRSLARSGLITR